MQREKRYTVLKDKDIEKYLSLDEKMMLARICRDIEIARELDGRRPLQCVVVEDDWPEYISTWSSIEARVAAELGREDEVAAFSARAEKAAQDGISELLL